MVATPHIRSNLSAQEACFRRLRLVVVAWYIRSVLEGMASLNWGESVQLGGGDWHSMSCQVAVTTTCPAIKTPKSVAWK